METNIYNYKLIGNTGKEKFHNREVLAVNINHALMLFDSLVWEPLTESYSIELIEWSHTIEKELGDSILSITSNIAEINKSLGGVTNEF